MAGFNQGAGSQEATQPKYKNYNQKINVITGEIEDINKKNVGYERFTESNQHLKSHNKSSLPADLAITDPITGRTIARR